MTAHTTFASPSTAALDKEKRHRWFVVGAYLLVFALIAAITIYGFDYYTLNSADGPSSPKHAELKPSGPIRIRASACSASPCSAQSSFTHCVRSGDG